MLAKKARLLVTNQLQYTREATAVVYLEDGRVAASGPYDQVVLNERFADMLREYEVRACLGADLTRHTRVPCAELVPVTGHICRLPCAPSQTQSYRRLSFSPAHQKRVGIRM